MREVLALDELRTWSKERLLRVRDEHVLEERRVRLNRLRIDQVLDERGATGGRDAMEFVAARDKVSIQTARGEVEVARALESLPAIAEAAVDGRLSMEQLVPLVELATPETDVEWATRAEHTAPSELNRLVAKQRVVTPAEMAARREARALRWWRSSDGEFLHLRGQLPDVAGALVEAVLEHEIESMKPAKGEAWDSRAHRGADALVAICERASGAAPAKRPWRPTVVVHVGSAAQPTVNGMPIATETVEAMIAAGARVKEVRADDVLAPKQGDRIPAALRTYLRGRDATCRVPGCGRAFGLEAHHIVPTSWCGRTDQHNVVLVCTAHHHRLVPHGRCVLDGDPEQPDGLAWRHLDDGDIDERAGPAA